MLKNTLMALPLAGALAVFAPGTIQQPQAAQFPHHSGYGHTPLLELVQDRLEKGGSGDRGSGDRGGADRGGGDRGMRSGSGETRSFGGDGGSGSKSRDTSQSREFRGDGDKDRGSSNRRVQGDNNDGKRDRNAQRDRGDGNHDSYNKRDSRHRDRGDRRHFHRGKRHVWGPGIEFWFYDGHYYGDCEWLRERATDTGSGYWWTRYQLCRDWS